MSRHGPLNNNWKGGRTIQSEGYVLIRVGTEHHLADVRGLAYEHRLVAEKMIGRRLKPEEHVHHKNEIKSDNRPENLEVMPSQAHHKRAHYPNAKTRKPGEDNPEIPCACNCGLLIRKYDGAGRPREFISGHNSGPKEQQVSFLKFLSTGPKTVTEMKDGLGRSTQAVKVMASLLTRQGKIKRVGHGVYASL